MVHARALRSAEVRAPPGEVRARRHLRALPVFRLGAVPRGSRHSRQQIQQESHIFGLGAVPRDSRHGRQVTTEEAGSQSSQRTMSEPGAVPRVPRSPHAPMSHLARWSTALRAGPGRPHRVCQPAASLTVRPESSGAVSRKTDPCGAVLQGRELRPRLGPCPAR